MKKVEKVNKRKSTNKKLSINNKRLKKIKIKTTNN